MKYNKLGNTDIKISQIGLGTMTFGAQNTEAEAHLQLDYAVSNGVNFIDTAELYAVPTSPETQGLTEKYIGSWLKNRKDRDKLIVASKIAGPGKFAEHIRPDLSFSVKHIEQAIEGSLKRLNTDYLDLYQLHWPERRTNFFGRLGYKHTSEDVGTPFHSILLSLKKYVDKGIIRNVGISNETPWGVMQFLKLAEMYDVPRIVSIQNPYSLINRSFEVGLSEMAIREEVSLLAYSPLGFGLLSGKYYNGKQPQNARLTMFSNRLNRYNSPLSHQAADRYADLALSQGISPSTLSLAFVNQQNFVSSTIIGATTMNQLKENIKSVEVTLTDETLEAIETIHQQIPNPAP